MKNKFIEWSDIEDATNSIFYDIYTSKWTPEIVTGISPNGVVPALLVANRVGAEFETITIDFDATEPKTELNLWLPELAFGVNEQNATGITGARWDPSLRKNILIVVTENDGKTLEYLINSWQDCCYSNEKEIWDRIWHKNVRFACIYESTSASVHCDYWWKELSADNEITNIYPWSVKHWTKKT